MNSKPEGPGLARRGVHKPARPGIASPGVDDPNRFACVPTLGRVDVPTAGIPVRVAA